MPRLLEREEDRLSATITFMLSKDMKKFIHTTAAQLEKRPSELIRDLLENFRSQISSNGGLTMLTWYEQEQLKAAQSAAQRESECPEDKSWN